MWTRMPRIEKLHKTRINSTSEENNKEIMRGTQPYSLTTMIFNMRRAITLLRGHSHEHDVKNAAWKDYVEHEIKDEEHLTLPSEAYMTKCFPLSITACTNLPRLHQVGDTYVCSLLKHRNDHKKTHVCSLLKHRNIKGGWWYMCSLLEYWNDHK